MKFGIPNKPLKWEQLYAIDFEIEIASSALTELNINQEKSLRVTKKIFDDFVENNRQAVESLPEEEQGSFYSHLHYYDAMMISDLQRLQRYSIIIIIFSVFESRLLSLCQEINKEFPEQPKLSEINEKEDLKKYWLYLTKAFCIDSTELQPLFQRFKQQKFLRNIITHHNGILSGKDKNKINITPGINLKSFGDEFIIEIHENVYVEYLLKYLKLFFRELTNKVDDRCRELKS